MAEETKTQKEETKKQKTVKPKTIVGLVLLVLFAAVTVLGFAFHDKIWNWCAGYTGNGILDIVINLIPEVISSVQILFVTLLVLYIVCTIIKAIFKGTPRRTTIGKLVNSIFKVVVWVVCVIAILAVWGINLTALIAGAGVLTLIIGLGMQSLIADVVAGIFIVCDGTLQVGDIVTIDGWRGTVQEIGIRNTKLINYSGDIRVANNSTIKVFINQSREDSYPTVIVGVPYEENLQHVKEVFEKNAQKIREMCPAVISDIDFNGVDNLSASSVDLHFGAKCKEGDFFAAQRQMRGAIKTVFEQNGIFVPFPQVVVHKEK